MPNKPLREIVSIKKGKQLNIEHMVHGGTFLVLNGGITPSGYTNDWNTEANTITISEGGNSCGYVSLVKQRFWSGGHNYTLNDCKIDKHYLYQYLKHKERQIMALRVGSGLPNIQMRSLVDFEVPILNEKEHYRIGSFLSAIDRLIDKQKEKVDKFKLMKKGYLQRMFPADRSDVPEIRFKGFSDAWKQCNWKDKVDISTNMVNPTTGEYDNLPHIGPGNIESYTGRLLDNVKTVKEDGLISGKFLFSSGDIIYGKINPQLGKYVYAPYRGLCSADCYVLKNKNGLKQSFLYTLLQTYSFFKYSVSVSMRSGMPKINRNELNEFKFMAPSNVEQNNIGSTILSIEKLITLNQLKLEQFKKLKSGYLQRVFADQEGNS